jgi:hypothetical protein
MTPTVKYSERNVSHGHFVFHKPHTNLESNPGFREARPATNRVPLFLR